MIQPALSRACMMSASHSSRVSSKPSRMPGIADGFAVLAFAPAGEIVGGAAGEILHGLDAVFADRDQHSAVTPGTSFSSSATPSSRRLGVEFGLDLRPDSRGRGPAIRSPVSSSKPSIEAMSFCVHHGEFLDRIESFRGEQLADHLVDVERLHEHLGALLELGLAALRFLLLGEDVDIPAGELGGEPHILAAPSDRERKLLVRDHDRDALAILVEHHLGDFGGRQRIDDEGRDVRPTTE